MANENITEEKVVTKRPINWRAIGIFFAIAAMILLLGVFAYGYFQLAKINMSLAQAVTQVQKQITSSEHDIKQLQESVIALQQTVEKSTVLSAKQEQLIADWQAAQQGELDKWFVAEAQYLVRLAQDHIQFTYNIPLALTLLGRADKLLDNIQDPRVIEMRKTIAGNMGLLQAIPVVDVNELYMRLTTLNNLLDQLPLPSTPLKESAAVQKQIDPTLPWWKRGMERSWQMLRQIVVVRYNGSNVLPLVLPEEKMFLYQNLHAQIENAIWAVLNHNNVIYTESLGRANAWIQKYFVQDSPVTKNVLQTIQSLQSINVQPKIMPNLSEALQQFDHYFAQTRQTKNLVAN